MCLYILCKSEEGVYTVTDAKGIVYIDQCQFHDLVSKRSDECLIAWCPFYDPSKWGSCEFA
ncbi:hypothetical protein KAR91_88160 [Candidatus Pacearchaeota archaeon]|nr:hypothetical protein [Candidatus Pacearchaeota archaeon]